MPLESNVPMIIVTPPAQTSFSFPNRTMNGLEIEESQTELLLGNENTQLHSPNQATNQFSYQMDWCYKKGKSKPQQYWVYCEESQDNYAKFTLQFHNATLKWTQTSKVMKLIHEDAILFVEDSTSFTSIRAIKIYYKIGKTEMIEMNTLSSSDLVSVNEFKFDVKIVEDQTYPIHPNQGKASSITTSYEFISNGNKQSLSTPFEYFCKFSFKNRAEGWFQLLANLSFDDYCIISNKSSLFMLNNPRMKKKDEFKKYPTDQVKFMQIYSLDPSTASHWMSLGKRLGYTDQLTAHLLVESKKLFSQSSPVIESNSSSLKKRKTSPVIHQHNSKKFRTFNELSPGGFNNSDYEFDSSTSPLDNYPQSLSPLPPPSSSSTPSPSNFLLNSPPQPRLSFVNTFNNSSDSSGTSLYQNNPSNNFLPPLSYDPSLLSAQFVKAEPAPPPPVSNPSRNFSGLSLNSLVHHQHSPPADTIPLPSLSPTASVTEQIRKLGVETNTVNPLDPLSSIDQQHIDASAERVSNESTVKAALDLSLSRAPELCSVLNNID